LGYNLYNLNQILSNLVVALNNAMEWNNRAILIAMGLKLAL